MMLTFSYTYSIVLHLPKKYSKIYRNYINQKLKASLATKNCVSQEVNVLVTNLSTVFKFQEFLRKIKNSFNMVDVLQVKAVIQVLFPFSFLFVLCLLETELDSY